MRCKLCDSEDPNIIYDPTVGDFTDCSECQDIIADALAEFGDEEEEDAIEGES